MKNAYLIIAHNNFEQLKLLLQVLDDKDNDIYLHIDKKSKLFDLKKCTENLAYSQVYQIDSMPVNWGGYSMVKCELNLLKAALPKKYDYYHLISGQDFPLHSQKQLKEFLEKNKGKEYIHFATEEEIKKCNVIDRVQYYHWFQEGLKSKNEIKKLFYTSMKNITLLLQRTFHIKRKINKKIQFGSQWFSITHDMADYIIQHEKEIYNLFKHSRCGDELFIQTICYSSPYYKNVYDLSRNMLFEGSLRLIDFERGNGKGSPYVFRYEDKDLLDKSELFFARKFDYSIDSKIIMHLYNKLKHFGH